MVFLIGRLNAWNASATDGLNCKGYSGVGSDGEYMYYTPYYNGSAYHGIVLRQKIFSIFKNAGTWEAYDISSIDGLTCKGYLGSPIFDGHYLYFPPYYNGAGSGIVLRYDTTKPFKSSASWAAYNAGAVDGLTSKGYWGGVFDGRYLYFVPHYNGSAYHGVFLRYDTTKAFKDASSWAAYDVGSMAGGAAKGYIGGARVGDFIYFSPWYNTGHHGQVLRLDITKPFKAAGSWTAFDAQTVSANCKALGVPCADEQYVFFPNAGAYGQVLRYDTTKPFSATSSYEYFSIASLSDNNESHNACCIQGHYLALAPSRYTILVYDMEKPFSDPGSWCEKEVAGADNSGVWGYVGAYSDPNYVYFAPFQQWSSLASSVHGTVLRGRIDPCPSQTFPAPGAENLNDYMLDDVGDYLTVTSARVSGVGMEPDMIALLYQDYNKDCFDGFEIRFELFVSNMITNSEYDDNADICTFSLSNRHSTYDPSLTDAEDPCVLINSTWDEDGVREGIWIGLCKLYTIGSFYGISEDTLYYCTLTRSDGGTTVTLRIYSDANRSNLLATLTESGFPSALKWRYIYAMRGSEGGEWEASYYLQNLNVVSY